MVYFVAAVLEGIAKVDWMISTRIISPTRYSFPAQCFPFFVSLCGSVYYGLILLFNNLITDNGVN
jgi:hypothetical protein